MARYQNDYVVLLLNNNEITGFADGSDVIVIENGKDAGEYVIGANGDGVFLGSCNRSGTLTIKLLQHSKDCKYLQDLYNKQRSDLKGFIPFTVDFKDTMNGDEFTGTKGFFANDGGMTRGEGHNPTTFKIVFEKLNKKLENGIDNE